MRNFFINLIKKKYLLHSKAAEKLTLLANKKMKASRDLPLPVRFLVGPLQRQCMCMATSANLFYR